MFPELALAVIGNIVVVVWNGTSEAINTMSSGMPFLAGADGPLNDRAI